MFESNFAGTDFDRLREFHPIFGLCLLYLCCVIITSGPPLICCVFCCLIDFFFAKSPLLISIDVFLPKIAVADLYRLHEFCAPNGSCLILLRVYRHCVLTQD